MKHTNLFWGILIIIGIGYLTWNILNYESKRRAKTFYELNYKGALFGVSNIKNDMSSGFRIGNIFLNIFDPFPTAELSHIDNQVVMITWEPYLKDNKNQSILRQIIDGLFDNKIKDFAIEAIKYKKPLMLRFGHEMNGNWYSWSGSFNQRSSSLYIASYKKIHGIFKENGAKNVFFIFSINFEDIPDEPWNKFENYYPGDEFVDLIGIDAYSRASNKIDPEPLLNKVYERVILAFPNKPMILSEIASGALGNEKKRWLEKLFDAVENKFTAIKAIVWFDLDKEEPWSLTNEKQLRDYIEEKLMTPYFSISSNEFMRILLDEKK